MELNFISQYWNWLMEHLGWTGQDLNTIQVILIILAFLGAGAILSRLLGSKGGSSSSTTNILTPRDGSSRTPNRMFKVNPKLTDFSINNKYYEIKSTTPEIKTDGLKGKLNLDMKKASSLFIPIKSKTGNMLTPTGRVQSSPQLQNIKPDWNKAKQLFVFTPKPEVGHLTGPPTQQSYPKTDPNWKEEERLFVPSSKTEEKEVTDVIEDTTSPENLETKSEPTKGPDWKLAQRLFVPRFKK